MDVRNVALSPSSAGLLRGVNAWPEQAAAYDKMRVWEERGTSHLDFDAASVNRSELGWLVEVAPLLDRLWQQLDREPNVTVVLGSISGVQPGNDSVRIALADCESVSELNADLLIASDGANSGVRRALQVPVRRWSTGQMALTTVVRTEQIHANTAWQRFSLDGPLALLPSVNPHVCSVVWSQSESQAERRLDLSDADFCRELFQASEGCLGQMREVGPRQAFPLNQQLAQSAHPHPRVLLLGDALRVVHPLAGLGVNLGFEDLRELLQIAAPGTELAQLGIWDKFARQRLLRSEIMLRSLDGLKRLYGNDNPWIGWVRNMGVGWFSRRQWLQRKAIEEATGLNDISA
jgi:ubiquinone biosynthesis UbiH/UbiF/VisC/COQ6 family hydroxylase